MLDQTDIPDSPSTPRNQSESVSESHEPADSNPIAEAYPPLPAIPHPYAGAWFQALDTDRSVAPPEKYRAEGKPLNTSYFGFISYPDDYIGGLKYAFIVNQDNTVFRRSLKDDIRNGSAAVPGPLKDEEFLHWPSDPDLKKSWSKLD